MSFVSNAVSSIFGGGGSSSTPQTVSTGQADPRVVDAYLANIDRTNQAIAQLPTQQYAGFTPDQQAGFSLARQTANSGVGQNAAMQGMDAARTVTNFQSQNIDPRQFASRDISNQYGYDAINGGSFLDQNIRAYMNPYLDSVAGNTLLGLDRARQMTTDNNAAAAIRSNAFGGSRQSVLDAETNRGFFDVANRSLADLYSGGYNAATGLAGQDLARALSAAQSNQQAGLTAGSQRLSADQSNQQAALAAAAQRLSALQANQQASATAAGLRLNAGTQLGNLGQQYQTMGYQNASALQDIGAQQQALETARLNAERDSMLQALGLSNAAVSGSPSGFSTSTQTPYSGPNVGSNILGGGLAGAGIGNLIGGTGLFGLSSTATGAGAGALLGLLSDKNMKEGKSKISEDKIVEKVANLPVEEWQYKKEAGMGTERHIGPYAQDFAEAFGGDGKTIGVLDAIGVNMAATKGLAKKVARLEKTAKRG